MIPASVESAGRPPALPRDFRMLWGGQVVSMFGAQIGDVAIRLLAAITLAATPVQLGLLSAAQTAAFLVVGLPAGAWIDRMRARSVLVVADLVRAALLITIPLAWWLGELTFVHVVGVVFLVGVAHVFFDVAYQAYLPVLVPREALVAANSRLESSRSVAAASGPALAGLLVQALRAANVVAIDAVGYIMSALFIRRIRTDRAPTPVEGRRSMWTDVGEGLRFVVRHPVLRALAGAAATYNFCYGMLIPLTLLLLVTELGLSAGAVGVLYAFAGIGGLGGALVAQRVIARSGMGRALIATEAVAAPCVLLLTLTDTGPWVVAFALGYLVMHFALSIFNVASVSVRQRLCPDHLMGRVTASMRFVVSGALPLGSLVGGVTGAVLGARGGLVIAGVGFVGAVVWLVASPLRRDHVQDVTSAPVDDDSRARAEELP